MTSPSRVAACALLLLVVAPAAAHAKDLAAHPGAIKGVAAEYRPEFRWWWPTDRVDPAELRAELRAVKRAGFGGVEQALLANGTEWGSPAFRARTRDAVREANRLGLSFDITLGPGWPVSSPGTDDLDREASMQDLHYGAVDLHGPTTYSGPVPDRAPPDAGRRRLIAVTAIRVAAGGAPQALDPGSAVDLTSRVANGALTWQVPQGSWKLFGFWMRPTLMRAKTSGGSPGWLVVDHFGRGKIDVALGDFDRMLFGGDMGPLLRRNGGDVFEDSFEVEHGEPAAGQSTVFWTSTLPQEFTARRRYALTPLLPGLFEEFAFPGGLAQRLRHDFEETLNDLLVDNHIEPIARWANRRGLRSRTQAYQAGLGYVGTSDNSRLAAAAQEPGVETLGFGDPTLGDVRAVGLGSADGRAVLDRYRQVVSGAHRSGATDITNEWGAVLSGQFSVRLEDLKAIADRSLAAGVSRMQLHGFAYRLFDRPSGNQRPAPSWPGWCAFCGGALQFSDSWNQRWPQIKSLPGLAAYLGRAGEALRSGRPRVDLSLLSATSVVNGITASSTAGTAPDRLRRALHRAGFTWDAIDPVSVRGRGALSGYRALVVDDQAALPSATAQRLVTLARAGLPVVLYGRVPAAGVGYEDAAGEDAAVATAMRQIRGSRNVRVARTPAALVSALRALSVRPDLQAPGATTIVPVHRRTKAGDVWFLYNDSPRRARGRYTFATPGAPSEIDLWTGRATRLAEYTRRGGRVSVPLSLAPGATALLSFDRRRSGRLSIAGTNAGSSRVIGRRLVLRDLRGGSRTARLSDGTRHTVRMPRLPGPRRVLGPWRLVADTTAPSGDLRLRLRLRRLAAWERVTALRGRAGTGTYTATVRIPRVWLGSRRGVLLDPGAFGGALRVWINGRRAAIPAIEAQGGREVTRLLRPGRNRLRLEVATTLVNAITTHGKTGDPDYVSYAARPLERSGLIGPVRLVPYAEATVGGS